MAKRKITTVQSLEESNEQLPQEKDFEPQVKPAEPLNPSKGKLCKVCSSNENLRYHEDNFDGSGVGHWPFSPGTKAERQFEFFCSQPRKTIFIPYLAGEKKGTLQTPIINGLKVGIRKGEYVDLPQGIADVIMESLNQTAKAEMESRLAPNPYTGERKLARLDQQDDISRQILGV